jgi:hypothetical protein
MTEKEYQRYWRRVAYYGFTPEEAFNAPIRVPLWMYRVEQEEGCSFVDFLKREFAMGFSICAVARSIEVHQDTLYHWVRKFRNSGLLS